MTCRSKRAWSCICSSYVHFWDTFHCAREEKKGRLSTLGAKGREQEEESESFVRTSGRRCWHLVALTSVAFKRRHANWVSFSFFNATSRTLRLLMFYIYVIWISLCCRVCGNMSYLIMREDHRSICANIMRHTWLCWSDAEIDRHSSAQNKNKHSSFESCLPLTAQTRGGWCIFMISICECGFISNLKTPLWLYSHRF